MAVPPVRPTPLLWLTGSMIIDATDCRADGLAWSVSDVCFTGMLAAICLWRGPLTLGCSSTCRSTRGPALIALPGLIVRTITVGDWIGGAGTRGYNAVSDERPQPNSLRLGRIRRCGDARLS